ncbi:MAG: hypothetical protein H0U74_12535 [Bradymonadaceae bacterium]|nr:hypothetical protein [Lujinxingiaceae bacterium]
MDHRLARNGVLAMFVALSGACSEPIHHGLNEESANQIVVVLEQHAIEAHKARDPLDDSAWVVSVPSGSRVEAWRILQFEGLPRPRTGGFDKYYPSGGLIPTASEERIVLQYATAQELQRALLKIEGVVDAHVNLVIPQKPRVQLSGDQIERPRASVLVQYRGLDAPPPIDAAGVRELIAGGVEGLEPAAIRVVMTPLVRGGEPLREPALVQVGPLAVAPASKTLLQMLLSTMGAVIMALAAATIYFVSRRGRS